MENSGKKAVTLNWSTMSYLDMAAHVHEMWAEAKRRNPLGVNFYKIYFWKLSSALLEMGDEGLDHSEADPIMARYGMRFSLKDKEWVFDPDLAALAVEVLESPAEAADREAYDAAVTRHPDHFDGSSEGPRLVPLGGSGVKLAHPPDEVPLMKETLEAESLQMLLAMTLTELDRLCRGLEPTGLDSAERFMSIRDNVAWRS